MQQTYWQTLVGGGGGEKRMGDSSCVPSSLTVTLDSVLRYPWYLCDLRATTSKLIPRLPDVHHFVKVPDGPAASSKDRKRIIPTKVIDPKTKREINIEPQQQSVFEVAKDIYKTSGCFGFYKGFLRNHLITCLDNLIAEGYKSAITNNTNLLLKKEDTSTHLAKGNNNNPLTATGAYLVEDSSSSGAGGESSSGACSPKEDLDSSQAVAKKISAYNSAKLKLMRIRYNDIYKRCLKLAHHEICKEVAVTVVGSLIRASIIYPIKTISVRCDAYVPFDNKPMTFIQMAKCSIEQDGFRSLYRGFPQYVIASVCNDSAEIGQNVALKKVEEDRQLIRLAASNIGSLILLLTAPLTSKSQRLQLESAIPGLIPKRS